MHTTRLTFVKAIAALAVVPILDRLMPKASAETLPPVDLKQPTRYRSFVGNYSGYITEDTLEAFRKAATRTNFADAFDRHDKGMTAAHEARMEYFRGVPIPFREKLG